MSREGIALSDILDAAIAFPKRLSTLLNYRVRVHLLTESKSFFDVISKGYRTFEKSTMLDVTATNK